MPNMTSKNLINIQIEKFVEKLDYAAGVILGKFFYGHFDTSVPQMVKFSHNGNPL